MKFRLTFLIIIIFIFSSKVWSATSPLDLSVLDETDFYERLDIFQKCYHIKEEAQSEGLFKLGVVPEMVDCVLLKSSVNNPLEGTLISLFSPPNENDSGPVFDFNRTFQEIVGIDNSTSDPQVEGNNNIGIKNNLLTDVVSNFSNIIFMVSLIFFGYVLVAFKYESARSGEFLGGKKGFDGMMSPLKLFFYGMLLLPSPFYGYSVVQVLVIFFAWLGVILSNLIWQYFLYLYLHDSLVEQVQTVPLDNEAETQSLQKELYSHFAANLLLEMIYLADKKYNFAVDAHQKCVVSGKGCPAVDEVEVCLNEADWPLEKYTGGLDPIQTQLKYKDNKFSLSAPQVFGLVSPDKYSCGVNISATNFGDPTKCMESRFNNDYCTFYESTMKELAFRRVDNDQLFLKDLMSIEVDSPWFNKLRVLYDSGRISEKVIPKLKAEEGRLAEKYAKFLAKLNEMHLGKDRAFQTLFTKYEELWQWVLIETKKPFKTPVMNSDERFQQAQDFGAVFDNLREQYLDFVDSFWMEARYKNQTGTLTAMGYDLKLFIERFSNASVAFASEFNTVQSSITDDLVDLSKQIMTIQSMVNKELTKARLEDFYLGSNMEQMKELPVEKKIEYLKILKIFTGDWLSIPAFLTLNTSKLDAPLDSGDHLSFLSSFEEVNPLTLLMMKNLENPVWQRAFNYSSQKDLSEQYWKEDLSAKKMDFVEKYYLRTSLNDIRRGLFSSMTPTVTDNGTENPADPDFVLEQGADEGGHPDFVSKKRRDKALERLQEIKLKSSSSLECVKSYDSCRPTIHIGFKKLMDDFSRPMYNTSTWMAYKFLLPLLVEDLNDPKINRSVFKPSLLQDFPLLDIVKTILDIVWYFVMFSKLILIYLPLIYILAFFINWIVSIFVLLFAGPILVFKAILPKRDDSSLSSHGDALYKTGLSIVLQPALVVIGAVVFMIIVPLMTNLGVFVLYPLISGTSSMPFLLQYFLLEFLNMVMLVFAIILSLKVLNRLPKDVMQWIKLKDSGATQEYDNLKSKVKDLFAKFFKLSLT